MSKWLVPQAALLLAKPGMYVASLVATRVGDGDLRGRQSAVILVAGAAATGQINPC